MVFQAVYEQMFNESFLFLSQMVLMNITVKGISFLKMKSWAVHIVSHPQTYYELTRIFFQKRKKANIYKLEEKLVTHFKLEKSSQIFVICFWCVGPSIYPDYAGTTEKYIFIILYTTQTYSFFP